MPITQDEFITTSISKAAEENWQHRWLTVIIPSGNDFDPLLISYCPNCKTAITQSLRWWGGRSVMNQETKEQPYQTSIDTPKYGCVAPVLGG